MTNNNEFNRLLEAFSSAFAHMNEKYDAEESDSTASFESKEAVVIAIEKYEQAWRELDAYVTASLPSKK
ncbi:hypothetical protein [Arthrobacter sp. CJ23]|uniref:hypothetical protein n=1 Tax=Arthrobacter sp. CJ23 TaxID=2972479 RepID=UPI00215C6951|nr:hypothetical protein [Arthrobacter sp. CJ23]UVJ37989.1 hypothetical protein NVV90_12000 [Arthrobacter sp. CJ23]